MHPFLDYLHSFPLQAPVNDCRVNEREESLCFFMLLQQYLHSRGRLKVSSDESIDEESARKQAHAHTSTSIFRAGDSQVTTKTRPCCENNTERFHAV